MRALLWPPVDVTGWEEIQVESRGQRPKSWICDPVTAYEWLRKEPRASRPSEPAIEVFALDDRRTRARPYRSRYLFATFAQRVPPPKRPDFASIMDAWGIERPDDPLEILARSGGLQMTDRLELAESRADDDELADPLEFRVAGMRHYERAAERLKQGQRLALRREEENAFDQSATLLLTLDDQGIGHVPRQYSALVARHLDAGHALEAVAVRRLSTPADPDRWIVAVRKAA